MNSGKPPPIRRPVGFWSPFNDWYRSQLSGNAKPPAEVVAAWYNENAAKIWPSEEDRPTWRETKQHAKCLRSTDDVKTYFQRYRANKKQLYQRTEQSDSAASHGSISALSAQPSLPNGSILLGAGSLKSPLEVLVETACAMPNHRMKNQSPGAAGQLPGQLPPWSVQAVQKTGAHPTAAGSQSAVGVTDSAGTLRNISNLGGISRMGLAQLGMPQAMHTAGPVPGMALRNDPMLMSRSFVNHLLEHSSLVTTTVSPSQHAHSSHTVTTDTGGTGMVPLAGAAADDAEQKHAMDLPGLPVIEQNNIPPPGQPAPAQPLQQQQQGQQHQEGQHTQPGQLKLFNSISAPGAVSLAPDASISLSSFTLAQGSGSAKTGSNLVSFPSNIIIPQPTIQPPSPGLMLFPSGSINSRLGADSAEGPPAAVGEMETSAVELPPSGEGDGKHGMDAVAGQSLTEPAAAVPPTAVMHCLGSSMAAPCKQDPDELNQPQSIAAPQGDPSTMASQHQMNVQAVSQMFPVPTASQGYHAASKSRPVAHSPPTIRTPSQKRSAFLPSGVEKQVASALQLASVTVNEGQPRVNPLLAGGLPHVEHSHLVLPQLDQLLEERGSGRVLPATDSAVLQEFPSWLPKNFERSVPHDQSPPAAAAPSASNLQPLPPVAQPGNLQPATALGTGLQHAPELIEFPSLVRRQQSGKMPSEPTPKPRPKLYYEELFKQRELLERSGRAAAQQGLKLEAEQTTTSASSIPIAPTPGQFTLPQPHQHLSSSKAGPAISVCSAPNPGLSVASAPEAGSRPGSAEPMATPSGAGQEQVSRNGEPGALGCAGGEDPLPAADRAPPISAVNEGTNQMTQWARGIYTRGPPTPQSASSPGTLGEPQGQQQQDECQVKLKLKQVQQELQRKHQAEQQRLRQQQEQEQQALMQQMLQLEEQEQQQQMEQRRLQQQRLQEQQQAEQQDPESASQQQSKAPSPGLQTPQQRPSQQQQQQQSSGPQLPTDPLDQQQMILKLQEQLLGLQAQVSTLLQVQQQGLLKPAQPQEQAGPPSQLQEQAEPPRGRPAVPTPVEDQLPPPPPQQPPQPPQQQQQPPPQQQQPPPPQQQQQGVGSSSQRRSSSPLQSQPPPAGQRLQEMRDLTANIWRQQQKFQEEEVHSQGLSRPSGQSSSVAWLRPPGGSGSLGQMLKPAGGSGSLAGLPGYLKPAGGSGSLGGRLRPAGGSGSLVQQPQPMYHPRSPMYRQTSGRVDYVEGCVPVPKLQEQTSWDEELLQAVEEQPPKKKVKLGTDTSLFRRFKPVAQANLEGRH